MPTERRNSIVSPFVIRDVQFSLSVVKPNDFPLDGLPEIAFAGRSNAGKSSILRLLLSRRALVRVSSTPGHTQALNYYRVDYRLDSITSGSCYFVDMPGYGFARAPKEVQTSWKRLIEAYLERRKTLVMLFCIFDIRRKPDTLDMSLLDYLRSVEIPFCILLNKADKLSYSQRLAARRDFDAMAFAGVEPVVVSAQTGLGMNEVKRIICEQLGGYVIN